MNRMLTTHEAAEVLRESAVRTSRRCASGQLPAVKVGTRWLISETDLEAFLAPSNTTKDEAPRGFVTAAQRRAALRAV